MTRLILVIALAATGCGIVPHQSGLQLRYDTESGRINEVDWSFTVRFPRQGPDE